MSSTKDDLATDPASPRLHELQEEFQRCSPSAGFWNRLNDNENTRYNLWENQTSDGKKHGTPEQPAKPWEGCSDQRVFLADEIVGDDVALCCTALWRTLLDVNGVGFEDDGDAAIARQVMNWSIHQLQADDLEREVELSCQYWRTYGWTVLHPTWEREMGLRSIDVSLTGLPDLAPVVVDPSLADEAEAMVMGLWDRWVDDTVGDLVEDRPVLSKRDARRIVTELRTGGVTKVEIPYVCRNEPSIRALRPWVDVFIPDDQGDLQRGRVYVRWQFRGEELDAKVQTDGWDEEWVEQAKKTKGTKSVWNSAETNNPLDRYTTVLDEDSEYVEVIFGYSRRINRQGIPATYLTVFSPHVGKGANDRELVAEHGILDYWHGKAPFIVLTTEWIARSVTSARGVPEVAQPMQRVEKVEQDSMIDRAALTTLPPRLVPARILQDNRNLEWGPAATIPILRGEDPRFMGVPARDGVAEAIQRQNSARSDSYFGRLSNEIPAPRTQVRQQWMVSKFLKAWAKAFRQEWALVQQFMSPREWERVTNVPKPQWGPNDVGRGYDIVLATDVRDFDSEFVTKKLEAVSKFVLPEDRAGVIDMAKLITMKLRAIDPLLAQQLVVNRGEASQKLFERVNMELASMFLGNPPQYVEGDPTAQQQLMFAQQIVQANPKYGQELGNEEGRFAKALKSWADNRMQSVTQEQNKQVGRLGVKPMEATQ